ncbi:MAG: signal peptidase I, partial [Bacilli bacterium]|nr:signal peptidase I [Bacilli bacterium]
VVIIVLNVLFYTFILFMLFFAIANIKAKSEDDIPNIFGRGFLSVQSDSMNGDQEDSFKMGDLVFVKMVDEDDVEELKVGDIITYYDYQLHEFNTHRIVEVKASTFVTQGDLAAKDPTTRYVPGEANIGVPYETVSKVEVKGLYKSSWSGSGKTYDFVVDNFEWTIVLPVALIVILEVVLLVRNIIHMNNAKLKEKYEKDNLEDLEDLEAAKEVMREQIREELKRELEEKDKKAEN